MLGNAAVGELESVAPFVGAIFTTRERWVGCGFAAMVV
jgi:hypothetical protein